MAQWSRRGILVGSAAFAAAFAGAAFGAEAPKAPCSTCDKPPPEPAAAEAKAAAPTGQLVKPPVIWDGKKMHETFSAADAKGNAFHFPGDAGRRKAYVAFDPQCSDCMTLLANVAPLIDLVDIAWFPIAFLTIHSEPQGALILSAERPWEKLGEQHDHFRDKEFRGLRYNIADIPVEARNKVWENTKMHRRSGCRAVPYGVYKNSRGVYMAFDETLSTEDLARLFEIR